MLLNLKQIGTGVHYGARTLDFNHELDLSAIRRWGEYPFQKPVLIAGTVRCEFGVYTMRYTARFLLNGNCSRCLVPVSKEYERVYEHVVMEEVQDADSDGELILAPDGMLNLDELIMSDLLLDLQGVMLCSEDCRGLCPKCGKNLNLGDCGCDSREPDPRFDALRKFLEQQ